MKSKRNYVLGVFVVTILLMAIGYTAFNTGLNILSSAYVNPNSGDFSIVFSSESNRLSLTGVQYEKNNDHVDVGTPVIDNTSTESPTISGLTANFVEPGDSVTYTFYTLNNGEYDAYLTKIIFSKFNDNSIKKCTADDGTSTNLVNKACSGIEMYITMENIDDPIHYTTNINNHILRKGASEQVQVTIKYESGSDRADGPFTVEFGDIKLIYATIDDGTVNDNYYLVSDDEHYITLNAMEGDIEQTGMYVENGDTFDLPEPEREGYDFDGWYLESSYVNQVFESGIIDLDSDETLYAKWEAETFDVTLNYNDENMPNEVITVTYGETYDLPQPTKTGYVFGGWYNGSDFYRARKISNGDMVDLTSDTTFYAKWDAESYNVSFDTGFDNISLDDIVVYYNSKYKNLRSLYTSGYTFKGWYLEDTFENKVENPTIVTKTSDHSLYAKWDVNTYTITFNSRGGTSVNDTMRVTYDTIYENLPTTERTGYTFLGWYTSGGKKIEEGNTVKITGDLTLYAKWEQTSYTVTFDVNTEDATLSTNSKTVKYNEQYSALPEPKKSGYNFLGWFDSKVGGTQITNKTIYDKTEDTTLYAHWEYKGESNYKVYHWQQDINGNASLYNEQNYTLVSTVTGSATNGERVTPEVNTYEGFYAPSKKTIIIAKDKTNEVDYYYKRKRSSVSITTSKGISNVTGGGQYYYQENVVIDYDVDQGYTFNGITGDFETDRFVMPGNQVRLSIKATPITHNISYDLDGGNYGSSHPNKVNSPDILALSPPTKTGSEFTGWEINGNVDGDTAKWGNSRTSIENKVYKGGLIEVEEPTDTLYFQYLSVSEGATVAFTAHWKSAVYTLSFDANGGEDGITEMTITYGEKYGNLPEAVRDGYTFDGWYTTRSGSTEITSESDVAVTKNQTLYAHWIVNNYDVELSSDSNGTLSESTISIPYGGTGTVTATTSPNYILKTFECSNGYSSSISDRNKTTDSYTVTITNNNKSDDGSCTATFMKLSEIGDEVKIGSQRFYVIGISDDKYILFAKYNLYNGTQYDCPTTYYSTNLCLKTYTSYTWKNIYWFDNEDCTGLATSDPRCTRLLDDINNTPKDDERAVGMKKVWTYAESLGGEGRLLTKTEAEYLKDNLYTIYAGTYATEGYLNYYLSTVHGGTSGKSVNYPLYSVTKNVSNKIVVTYTYVRTVVEGSGGQGLRPVIEIDKTKVTPL